MRSPKAPRPLRPVPAYGRRLPWPALAHACHCAGPGGVAASLARAIESWGLAALALTGALVVAAAVATGERRP